MVQSDDANQFWIIPWDMDSTFIDPLRLDDLIGARPDFDEPSDQCSGFTPTGIKFTPPSCFKMVANCNRNAFGGISIENAE